MLIHFINNLHIQKNIFLLKNIHLRFVAVYTTYLSNKYLFSTFVTIVISEKIPTSLKILSSSLCESKTFFVFNCNIIYYCIDKHIFHCHLIICIDFNKKVYLIGVTVNGLSTKWLVSQVVVAVVDIIIIIISTLSQFIFLCIHKHVFNFILDGLLRRCTFFFS